MSTNPKQIVVDKDAFIGMGIDALCDFAADHLLLCCDTLLYECATTSEANPKRCCIVTNGLFKAVHTIVRAA